jgi:hypothetical protein
LKTKIKIKTTIIAQLYRLPNRMPQAITRGIGSLIFVPMAKLHWRQAVTRFQDTHGPKREKAMM